MNTCASACICPKACEVSVHVCVTCMLQDLKAGRKLSSPVGTLTCRETEAGCVHTCTCVWEAWPSIVERPFPVWGEAAGAGQGTSPACPHRPCVLTRGLHKCSASPRARCSVLPWSQMAADPGVCALLAPAVPLSCPFRNSPQAGKGLGTGRLCTEPTAWAGTWLPPTRAQAQRQCLWGLGDPWGSSHSALPTLPRSSLAGATVCCPRWAPEVTGCVSQSSLSLALPCGR